MIGQHMLRPNVVKPAFSVVVIAVLVSFWTVFATNRELRQRRVEALRRGQRPYVLNGMTLRLDGHTDPVVRPGHADAKYLVLLSADECPYSKVVVKSWLELIANTAFGPHDRVLLLTVSGLVIPNALGDALASRGVGHEVLRIRSATGFAQESGLASTPMTILLDSTLRVRLVSGRFSPVVAEEVRRFFRRA